MYLRATAILIIIEGQFQAFQRFSGSKLLLQTVGSHFAAFNYYENGSMHALHIQQPSSQFEFIQEI
jgi:hypothetical protein